MSKAPRFWHIRIVFEPNRFSSERLRDVYQQIKPVSSVTTSIAQPQISKKRGSKVGGQS